MRFSVKFAGVIGLAVFISVSQAFANEFSKAPPVPLSQTVPLGALGYVPLLPGEIRPPRLGYKSATAVVMSSEDNARTEGEIAIDNQAQRLIDQGQGQAALDYLKANLSNSPHGIVELALANFYLSKGKGGVTVPQDEGYTWLERAAEKAPFYWFHVGNGYYNGSWGAQKDPVKAAQAWAKGVSLGCSKCAVAMGDFWEGSRYGVKVSLADAYAYTVFAIEIGTGLPKGERLTKILEKVPSNSTGVLAEAAQLKADIFKISPSREYYAGGVARAIYTKYRTGMVPEDVWIVDKMIENGKYADAYARIGNYSVNSGRYMSAQFEKLFLASDKHDPDFFSAADRRVATVYALIGGDISKASAAAEIFLVGYDVTSDYETGETVRFHDADKGEKISRTAVANGMFDSSLSPLLDAAWDKQFTPPSSNQGWSTASQPANDCRRVYTYASQKYTSGGSGYSDASVGWLLDYESNKDKPCDLWPEEITPPGMLSTEITPAEKAYTLEQGLQDIARAAACTHQEERCVNDGQYQRCSMVTVNTC